MFGSPASGTSTSFSSNTQVSFWMGWLRERAARWNLKAKDFQVMVAWIWISLVKTKIGQGALRATYQQHSYRYSARSDLLPVSFSDSGVGPTGFAWQCNLIWGAEELKHPSTQHLNSNNLVATKRHHPIVYIGGPCVHKELGPFSHFQCQEQLQCTSGSSWLPSRTISFALWWHHQQPVRPGSLTRKHKMILKHPAELKNDCLTNLGRDKAILLWFVQLPKYLEKSFKVVQDTIYSAKAGLLVASTRPQALKIL